MGPSWPVIQSFSGSETALFTWLLLDLELGYRMVLINLVTVWHVDFISSV